MEKGAEGVKWGGGGKKQEGTGSGEVGGKGTGDRKG